MQNIKILRTNLVFEANETQLYEGTFGDQPCYVKTDLLANFLKKYHVKDLPTHLKIWFELKAPEKFIVLLKCCVVQNKIYLFINADKSMRRLSGKLKRSFELRS